MDQSDPNRSGRTVIGEQALARVQVTWSSPGLQKISRNWSFNFDGTWLSLSIRNVRTKCQNLNSHFYNFSDMNRNVVQHITWSILRLNSDKFQNFHFQSQIVIFRENHKNEIQIQVRISNFEFFWNLVHTIWSISYGPYYMDHIIWTILYGPYYMEFYNKFSLELIIHHFFKLLEEIED